MKLTQKFLSLSKKARVGIIAGVSVLGAGVIATSVAVPVALSQQNQNNNFERFPLISSEMRQRLDVVLVKLQNVVLPGIPEGTPIEVRTSVYDVPGELKVDVSMNITIGSVTMTNEYTYRWVQENENYYNEIITVVPPGMGQNTNQRTEFDNLEAAKQHIISIIVGFEQTLA